MAVPKKRTSVARKGLRRAGHTHKLNRTFTINCPNCGNAVVPLHVCPSCGVYKGREVIEFRDDDEEDVANESGE